MMLPRLRMTLAAMLVIAAHCVPVNADNAVMGPSHIARVKSVTSAVVSPDGKYVAYSLSVPRDPMSDADGSAWTELHVVDPMGRSRPFVTGQVNVSTIQWTPDGRGIAFVAKRDGDAHAVLYVLPVDGGEALRTISHNSDLHGVAFSKDGKQVAFLAKEPLAKEIVEYQVLK